MAGRGKDECATQFDWAPEARVERLNPSAIRIAVGLAEDLAYAARELAYAVAMTTVSSAENTALCSKAKRLHGEHEEYCKEIKSAGANFRCNDAGPAKLEISPGCQGSDEPEASVRFGNREALVDLEHDLRV